MIKNLFIPNMIKGYYIFPQSIVGIDITKTYIYATKIIASGYKRTIIENIDQAIDPNEGLTSDDKMLQALQEIKHKLKSYDILNIALPSSNAVFKDITIPFLGIQKVKKVVPFEVESMLPFSLNQAVIDSIITQENQAQKETEVLVAAIPQPVLNNYNITFSKADLKPDKVTIDMFEIYSFYKDFYKNQDDTRPETVALIDLDLYATRIALIIDGQLKYIRTLSKGLKNIAASLAQSANKSNAAILEDFIRFGVQADNEDAFKDLVSELQFTLITSLKKFSDEKKLDKVILTGLGTDIQGITSLICSMLKTDCHALEISKILHNGSIYSNIGTINNRFLTSLATALPSKITQEFNLSAQAYEKKDTLIAQQILALLALSILFITSFLGYSFITIRSLRNAYNTTSNQAISSLKNRLQLSKNYRNLAEANEEAKKKLRGEQETISQLLNKNNYSFLVYLDELSRIIDQERTGLIINKMNISPKVITILGSVKDIVAVKILENQLEQSSLFTLKTSLQTPDFTKNPLILDIDIDKDKDLP